MACTITLPGGQLITTPSSLPCGGFDIISPIFGNALTIILTFAVILALILLTWSGVQWAASGGNKEKIARARSRITFTIVGLLVCFLAVFLVNIIGAIFKVNLF